MTITTNHPDAASGLELLTLHCGDQVKTSNKATLTLKEKFVAGLGTVGFVFEFECALSGSLMSFVFSDSAGALLEKREHAVVGFITQDSVLTARHKRQSSLAPAIYSQSINAAPYGPTSADAMRYLLGDIAAPLEPAPKEKTELEKFREEAWYSYADKYMPDY